jgi:thioredoxin-related protein
MVSSSLKSRYNSRLSSFSESSSGFWLLVIFLIVLIITSIMVGTYYKKYENFSNSDFKSYTLQYYCMERCGHCREFEDTVWTDFSYKVNSNPEFYHFDVAKYDITKDGIGKDLGEKYYITSTPSFLLYNKETMKVYQYSNDRTEKALVNFANEIIKQEHPDWTFIN